MVIALNYFVLRAKLLHSDYEITSKHMHVCKSENSTVVWLPVVSQGEGG